jgi:two-component system, sensor histidine kinase RegB
MKAFAASPLSPSRAESIATSVAPALTSSAVNLRRLVVLRAIALAGEVLAIVAAVAWLQIALPLEPIALILLAAAAVNALTWARLARDWPVGDIELFAHLTFDVFALTGVLYFAGGPTNPFVSLYLLPLTLTAAALPWRYTWVMALLALACYSVLLVYYVPLYHSHAGAKLHELDDFKTHVFGMWLGFILSAGLIAYFAVRMRETLRERDRLRAQMREQELRHERVLALGTLAAGAAHELGTPLSTIAVLTTELARDSQGLTDKLKMLREQVGRCKEILSSLSAAVGETRAEGGGVHALDEYLDGLLAQWRASHARINVRARMDGSRPPPRVVTERTLGQALLNVLNNAADVSVDEIEVDARWSETELIVQIRDRGPGLSPEVQEHAGEPFFSTKEPGAGMGLGLFLARGTIERLGGTLQLTNRDGGGAVCRVQVPLAALRIENA